MELKMKKIEADKPDEFYVINSDGTESVLHVDFFTKPQSRSKNPRRIQIIHVDDGVPHKSFQEELQEILAESSSSNLSFETKH